MTEHYFVKCSDRCRIDHSAGLLSAHIFFLVFFIFPGAAEAGTSLQQDACLPGRRGPSPGSPEAISLRASLSAQRWHEAGNPLSSTQALLQQWHRKSRAQKGHLAIQAY